jgi:phosphoribosylaminoimidazole carboxylase / phosphoribosylaminoimidazole-succinocarboxamide synthase
MSLISEGKTKIIQSISAVRVLSKSDITAGDGAKHDILERKGEFSTRTTSNVFKLLAHCGHPVAFYAQDSSTSFIAPLCRMLPFEVVVRGEAHGSYLKRNLELSKGFKFEHPIVEFYLKTSGRMWKDFGLLCDDPLMEFIDTGEGSKARVYLWQPDRPMMVEGGHFLELDSDQIVDYSQDWELFGKMEDLAAKAFLILRNAWAAEAYNLVDFKVEFGIDSDGVLLIADVIDNDSWRLLHNGEYMDKQVYRDGGNLEKVRKNYEIVAELTEKFQEWYETI